MKYVLFCFILILFPLILTTCQEGYESHDLIGKWQVDSVYTYYNGFSYRSTDNFIPATYTYSEDGTLREEKLGEGRTIYYQLSAPDSLIYESADQTILGRYHIQKLDHQQMVLAKDKAPLFGGKAQQRYEVRFFSKMSQ